MYKVKQTNRKNNRFSLSTDEMQENGNDCYFLTRHSCCFLLAQVFSGELHFQSEVYQPEMANRSSNVFREKATQIENEVSSMFFLDASK